MSKDKTTAQLQTELDAIIEWFQSDNVDLDEAAAKYKQGTELIAELEKRLKTAENVITILTKA